MDAGAFVISLDFELFWGVRDTRTLANFGQNILGGREVIPVLLDVFAAREIRATWATVGFLFCADKEELLASLPRLRPDYDDTRLSPYGDIEDIGPNERSDPYHFGQSLVCRIKSYEDQEIGTHTFSHFYCLERGGSPEALRSDLETAKALAAKLGVRIDSIVFPRNQFSYEHLRIARELGITAFRGNQRIWFHRASREAEQTLTKRAVRLIDTYVPVAGAHIHEPELIEDMVDVAASHFLRPAHGNYLDQAQFMRISSAMTRAAKTNTLFHLWWHPHNFGVDVNTNIAFLVRLLDHFTQLQHRFGMRSLTMRDLAKKYIHECGPTDSK